jgi:hypothetical protein
MRDPEIIELRKQVNALEAALHYVIEALHYDNVEQRKQKAAEAFERMPL